jgi:hypothetical protein
VREKKEEISIKACLLEDLAAFQAVVQILKEKYAGFGSNTK